jgi:hypothetical protein
MFKSKQLCVNCHFFEYVTRNERWEEHNYSLKRKERNEFLKGDFNREKKHSYFRCYFHVWDEGTKSEKFDLYKEILQKNRRGKCFYFRHREGMLTDAARLMQEREEEYRRAHKDRILTIIGLWIAAIALIINILIKLFLN